MADPPPLRLLAEDPADLPVVSALIQDAVARAGNISFDPRARRLTLLVSRYRWEARGRTRVPAALRVESVLKAERRNWPVAADAALEVLALRLNGEDTLLLTFAGGAEARLTVEAVDLVLEDLGPPRAAASEPAHRD